MHSLYQTYVLLYNLNNPLVHIHQQFICNVADDYLKLYSLNLARDLIYLGPKVANTLSEQFETHQYSVKTSLLVNNILNLPAKSVCVLVEDHITKGVNACGIGVCDSIPSVGDCDLIINKHRIWAHRIIYCGVTITYIGLLTLSGWLN
jgi:hypothetical protein